MIAIMVGVVIRVSTARGWRMRHNSLPSYLPVSGGCSQLHSPDDTYLQSAINPSSLAQLPFAPSPAADGQLGMCYLADCPHNRKPPRLKSGLSPLRLWLHLSFPVTSRSTSSLLHISLPFLTFLLGISLNSFLSSPLCYLGNFINSHSVVGVLL